MWDRVEERDEGTRQAWAEGWERRACGRSERGLAFARPVATGPKTRRRTYRPALSHNVLSCRIDERERRHEVAEVEIVVVDGDDKLEVDVVDLAWGRVLALVELHECVGRLVLAVSATGPWDQLAARHRKERGQGRWGASRGRGAAHPYCSHRRSLPMTGSTLSALRRTSQATSEMTTASETTPPRATERHASDTAVHSGPWWLLYGARERLSMLCERAMVVSRGRASCLVAVGR